MGIDNIRHPIKDTVKADNSTYSSNKIESLIHSATELPETSIEDAGDILMVNDEGEWAKGEIIIPQELPTPTAENIGKVVTVVSDGDDGAEYGLETQIAIPTPTSSKKGQIIGVDSSGNYALMKPSAYAFELKKDGTNTLKFGDTTVLFTDLIQLIPYYHVTLSINTSIEVAPSTFIQLPHLYFESMKSNNTLRFSNTLYSEGDSKLYYVYIDIDMASHIQGPITNLTVNATQITTS